ncbi:hypothetical protein KUCAC02_022013, partial [Chaenocephalus aceratus]
IVPTCTQIESVPAEAQMGLIGGTDVQRFHAVLLKSSHSSPSLNAPNIPWDEGE